MMESSEVETQQKTNNWVIFGTSTPPLTLTIDHFRWNDDEEVAESSSSIGEKRKVNEQSHARSMTIEKSDFSCSRAADKSSHFEFHRKQLEFSFFIFCFSQLNINWKFLSFLPFLWVMMNSRRVPPPPPVQLVSRLKIISHYRIKVTSKLHSHRPSL